MTRVSSQCKQCVQAVRTSFTQCSLPSRFSLQLRWRATCAPPPHWQTRVVLSRAYSSVTRWVRREEGKIEEDVLPSHPVALQQPRLSHLGEEVRAIEEALQQNKEGVTAIRGALQRANDVTRKTKWKKVMKDIDTSLALVHKEEEEAIRLLRHHATAVNIDSAVSPLLSFFTSVVDAASAVSLRLHASAHLSSKSEEEIVELMRTELDYLHRLSSFFEVEKSLQTIASSPLASHLHTDTTEKGRERVKEGEGGDITYSDASVSPISSPSSRHLVPSITRELFGDDGEFLSELRTIDVGKLEAELEKLEDAIEGAKVDELSVHSSFERDSEKAVESGSLKEAIQTLLYHADERKKLEVELITYLRKGTFRLKKDHLQALTRRIKTSTAAKRASAQLARSASHPPNMGGSVAGQLSAKVSRQLVKVKNWERIVPVSEVVSESGPALQWKVISTALASTKKKGVSGSGGGVDDGTLVAARIGSIAATSHALFATTTEHLVEESLLFLDHRDLRVWTENVGTTIGAEMAFFLSANYVIEKTLQTSKTAEVWLGRAPILLHSLALGLRLINAQTMREVEKAVTDTGINIYVPKLLAFAGKRMFLPGGLSFLAFTAAGLSVSKYVLAPIVSKIQDLVHGKGVDEVLPWRPFGEVEKGGSKGGGDRREEVGRIEESKTGEGGKDGRGMDSAEPMSFNRILSSLISDILTPPPPDLPSHLSLSGVSDGGGEEGKKGDNKEEEGGLEDSENEEQLPHHLSPEHVRFLLSRMKGEDKEVVASYLEGVRELAAALSSEEGRKVLTVLTSH